MELSNFSFNTPGLPRLTMPRMGRRTRDVHQTAMPLMKRITERKLSRKQVADALGIDFQNVTNWLARGVPDKRMPQVADLCGLTTDEYRQEAGLQVPIVKRPTATNERTVSHVDNFEALPDYLQAIIAKKTDRLRKGWDAMPPWLKEKLRPPTDPKSYSEWEAEIESLIEKFREE